MSRRTDLYEKVLQAALCMTRQCWEQGMLSYALIGSGHDAVMEMMAYDMVLRQSADGRLCNVEDTPAVTDSAFCIPAVYAVGKEHGIEAYLKAVKKNTEYLLYHADRTADGVLFHMRGTTQIWADSAAFLPYALVLAGYPKEGFMQLKGLLRYLYIPHSGLYAHIRDGASEAFPDGNAWSIGVMWILSGMLRTLYILPSGMREEREELKSSFVSLLDNCLRYQTAGGGFCDVMDDSGTYEETESAAMGACCIYSAIRNGIIPADYKGLADRMAVYVLSKILPDGRVTDAASSPSFDRPGTSVECQAHVLMMLSLMTDDMFEIR